MLPTLLRRSTRSPLARAAMIAQRKPVGPAVAVQARSFLESHVSQDQWRNVKKTEDAVNNILYNIPSKIEKEHRHILQALVSDEPGVLSRVSGLLASRGFNIDSLMVSATEAPNLSRITIVIRGKDTSLHQAIRQLEDLVSVWAVLDFSGHRIIERELLLIKVSTAPSVSNTSRNMSLPKTDADAYAELTESHTKRHAISQLVELFQGKIIDVSTAHCTVELCSKKSRVDAFIGMMRPFGIIECSRSGVMAMVRSALDGVQAQQDDDTEAVAPTIDDTQLPPG